MIFADIEKGRKAFLREWRLKCRTFTDSLEEAGARLFTFTRLDPLLWKSTRTINAIERLKEEFRRRINTQTMSPGEVTAAGGWLALPATHYRLSDGRRWDSNQDDGLRNSKVAENAAMFLLRSIIRLTIIVLSDCIYL